MNIKRFPQSKSFRVIINDVSFYATAKQIRSGVGDRYSCNSATQKVLDALEYTRSSRGLADQCACGIAGVWDGMNVQLNVSK